MDNWRKQRYSNVSKALQRVERRSDKLVERINAAASAASTGRWQDQRQISAWTNEVTKLQGMNDRLLDFRSSLYLYSNLDYGEALNEWENEVEKICKEAEEFSHPAAAARNRHDRSAVSETVVHRLVSSVY